MRLQVVLSLVLAALIALPQLANAGMPPKKKKGNNGGNISCPAGSVEIAKFEWKGGGYIVENGPNGVTLTGNPSTAQWTSNSMLRYVIIKGATLNYTYDITNFASSGTLSSVFIGGHGISNVKFCYVDPCPYSQTQPSWDGSVKSLDPAQGIVYLNIQVPSGYQGITLAAPSTNVALNGVYSAAGYPGVKTAAQSADTDVMVELQALGAGRSSFFLEVTDGCSRVLYVDPQFERAEVPAAIDLEQNSPNPFNPTTNIRFHLQTEADVHLAVYDLLGRSVKTLMDATLSADSYDVVWDGTNDAGQQLPSGVYLYRIQAGDHSEARVMTLLK